METRRPRASVRPFTCRVQVSLKGGGTVLLHDLYYDSSSLLAVIDGEPGAVLDNSDNTVTGYGLLGGGTAGLANRAGGTIQATTHTLTVDTGGSAIGNAGLLRALAGGSLLLDDAVANTGTIEADATGTVTLRGAVANAGGLLSAKAGGVVVLDGGQVTAGQVSSEAGGTITVATTGLLDGTAHALALAGTLAVSSGATLSLRGAVANTGTIEIDANTAASSTQPATLRLQGAVSLTGGGKVVLEDLYYASSSTLAVLDGEASASLDNVDNTITGYGLLGSGLATLTNEAGGVIQASQRTLTLDAGVGRVVNAGLIEAANGTLELRGTVSNTGGLIAARTSGAVRLDGVSVSGGTVSAEAGASLDVTSTALLDGSAGAVTVAGTLAIDSGATLAMRGTVANTGTIAIDGNTADLGQAATLHLQGAVSLKGGGTVLLQDLYYAVSSSLAVIDGEPGVSLDNLDNTITGYGLVSVSLTNEAHGTIEGHGGTLSVTAGTVTNNGTVSAASGTVSFAAGTAGNLAGGTLTGGTWMASGGTIGFANALVTDAARIVLDGAGSSMDAGGTSIEATLTGIAAGGSLELLGGRGWASTLGLANAGTLRLGGGTFAAGLTNTGAIVGSGTLAGPVTNTGTITADGVLVLDAATGGAMEIGRGSELDLAGGQSTGSVAFADAGTLRFTDAAASPGVLLENFRQGDTIDLAGLGFTDGQMTDSYSEATGLLTIGNGTATATLSFGAGNTVVDDPFHLASDGAGGTMLTNDTPACYCPGTLILTSTGERPIETLAVGDLVVTASGACKPIRWIGRRSYGPRFVAANPALRPVRFTAGALGGGLPRRDLLVSQKHAMFLNGFLVPAEQLVDGQLVRYASVSRVDYLHLELDEHDVVLAEGSPSETFVDDGSRGIFHNAADYRGPRPASAGSAQYCAPRLEGGYELDGIRRALSGQRSGIAG